MYPLQLLMGNMSLATILATTAQPAAPVGRPTSTTPPPTVVEIPAPTMGTKWWCLLSNQGVASPKSGESETSISDVTLEEWSHWRWKKRRSLAKLLKESSQEAFSKDTEIIKAARWAYYPSCKGMFAQEGSYDLTSIFREMAQETNLLIAEIHEVQEVWTSGLELKAANHTTKASQWEIQFFHTVSPTESPNIMGLRWIHSPKALHQWGSHSYSPWCGKEGQNESIVVNYLWNVHYHLGLICALCWEYFSMSLDTVRWHASSCEALTTKDKAPEEEERVWEWHWQWGWWVANRGNLILTPTSIIQLLTTSSWHQCTKQSDTIPMSYTHQFCIVFK